MYQATAPNQLPTGAAFDTLIDTWSSLLAPIPADQLQSLFNAALAEHMAGPRATYPMGAAMVLRQWESTQAPPPVTHGFRAWRAALGLAPDEMTTPGPVLTEEWKKYL
jgi:hypothetical protein